MFTSITKFQSGSTVNITYDKQIPRNQEFTTSSTLLDDLESD